MFYDLESEHACKCCILSTKTVLSMGCGIHLQQSISSECIGYVDYALTSNLARSSSIVMMPE